ncbi:hypothetical protein GCM10020367_59370 [Streptomyces sannanensis]|uniref:Protein kinase domain-containing protein n=1 Tax=Streptomyces sannanensis TaxID=285536 RepID=A0ABP6SJU2_9ACTN
MSEIIEWASAADRYATSLSTDASLEPGLAAAAAPVAVVMAREALSHAYAVTPDESLAVRHVESLARAFTADDRNGIGALLDFWYFAWTGRFATGGFLGDEALPRSLKSALQTVVSAGGRPALRAAQGRLLREAERRLAGEVRDAAAADRVLGKELFLRPLQELSEEGPSACLLLTRSPADAVRSVNNSLPKSLAVGGLRWQQAVDAAARIAARMREVVALADVVQEAPPPPALQLGDGETAQLPESARILLPMVLLDLTDDGTDVFDAAPVLDLLEEHLSPLETDQILRPALVLGETGREGGAVAEVQRYLKSLRSRLDGIARHIGRSPELLELLKEVRGQVAQGWTGQVDSLLDLARPLVLRGERLERTSALRAKLAELAEPAAGVERDEELSSGLARLVSIVDTAERTDDEDAAAQLLALAEESAARLAPPKTAAGVTLGVRTPAEATYPRHGSGPAAVPPIVLLSELLEDTWHPLLSTALRSVTDPRKAAEAFEALASTGSGPVQQAAAVCAMGWAVLDGRPEHALEQHGRLAARAGRSATRYWNEGCARGALGDIDGAVTAFEAVARLGDSPPQLVLQPVVDLFRAAGRPSPFREPLRQGPAPEARIDAFAAQRFEATAKQLRLSGRTADAELLLETLTEVSPTAPGRSLLMKIYREERRLADAEQFVERVRSRGAADWMLDFDLALVAVASGDAPRACELRDRLVALGAPAQHLVQLDRRLTHDLSARPAVSGPVAPRPGQPPRLDVLPPILLHEDLLPPTSVSLPDGLQAALMRTESPLEAAHAFADWSAVATGLAAQAAAVCAIGWACRAGDAELAAGWTDSLLPADATGWLLWNRACALDLLGDPDGAARTLEQALDSGDQPPQAVWSVAAERLAAAGRPVPSSPYAAVRTGPPPPARIALTASQTFESLAKRMYEAGHRSDAEWLLRALVEAAPRTPGRLLLMKIWREERRLDDALALVSRRRALGEEDWRLYYETGLVAVAAGRQDVALDMRQRVAGLGGAADWLAQLDRKIGTQGPPMPPVSDTRSRFVAPEQLIVQRALSGPQNKAALLGSARQLLDEQGPSSVLSVARQLERTAPWAGLTLLDLLIDRIAQQADREAPSELGDRVVASGDAKLVGRLAAALEASGDDVGAAQLLGDFAERCRPNQRPRIWHQLMQLQRRRGLNDEADALAARTSPPLPPRPLEPEPGRAVPLNPRFTALVLPSNPDGSPSLLQQAHELDQLHGHGPAADTWCAALDAGHVLAYPHALGALVAADRPEEALELYRRYAEQLWTGSSTAWNIAAAYAGLGLLSEAADTLEYEAQISNWTAPAPEDRARRDEIFRAEGRPSPGSLLTENSAAVVAGPAPTAPPPDQGVRAAPAGPAGKASARVKPIEWENRTWSDALRTDLSGSVPGSPDFGRRTDAMRGACGRLIDGLAAEAERFARPAPRSIAPAQLERMTTDAQASFAEGLAAAQGGRWQEAARAWRGTYDRHPRNEVVAANLALSLLMTGEQTLAGQLVGGFAFSSHFIQLRAAVAYASGGSAAAVAEITRMRAEDLALGRTELPLAQAGFELHHLSAPGAAARTLLSVATDRPPGLGRMFAAVALLLGQEADDDTLVDGAHQCFMRQLPPVGEVVQAALRERRPDHLLLVPGLLRGNILGKVANARSTELRRDPPSHRRLQLLRTVLEQRRGSSPNARWHWARTLWQDGESAAATLEYRAVAQELAAKPGRPRLAAAVEEWIQAARSSGDTALHRAALAGKQDLGLPLRTRELEILRGDDVAPESLLLDLTADLVSFEAADVVEAPLEAVHRLDRIVETVRSLASGGDDEVTTEQLADVWYHQLAQDIDSDEGRERLMALRKQAQELSRRVGDPVLRDAVQRVSVVTYQLWEESGRRLLPPRVEEPFTVTGAELWRYGTGPVHVRLTVEPQLDGGQVEIGWNGSSPARVRLSRGRSHQVVFRVDELFEVDQAELEFRVYRPGVEMEMLRISYPVEDRPWPGELGRHAFAAGSPANDRIRVPREAELALLRNHYTGRPAAPVRFLHGPRQVGKTTLARSLSVHPLPEDPAEWPLPGVLAVEINGEEWSHLGHPPLWEWLAEQVLDGLQRSWPRGTHSTGPLPATAYDFRKWLTGMRMEGLDQWRLLLMVDEFQTLLDRVSDSGMPIAHLGDQLRAMASSPAVPLLLLTLGSCSFESLKARLLPHRSNLTDEIREFPVGFMEPDQARLIFQRGFDDGVFLQQAVVERVVEYTGGYPYHVHCMGEELVKLLEGRRVSVITPEDVEAAAVALVERPEVIKPIADLQNEPGVEKAVAHLLENATGPDETTIDGDAVEMATDPEVDRGLGRIRELGLIRRDGHSDWVWSNMLIYLWLKERHARLQRKQRAREAERPAATALEPAEVKDPAEALREAGFVLGEELGRQTIDGFATVRKVSLNGRTAVAKLLNPDGDTFKCQALEDRFDAIRRSVSGGVPQLLQERGVVDGKWFVFDWVEGITLAEVARRYDRRQYHWQQAVAWIAEAADIVARVYRAGGLTHGDVKPENIVLAPDHSRVTVLDWGGGSLDGQVSPLFRDHAGDQRYAAEGLLYDIEGERGALAEDDAYSLAATLFELVHPERRPLSSYEPLEKEDQIYEIEGCASLALSGALRKALLAPPARRFQDAAELAAELRRAAQP